jgi:hypothetical protein
MSTTPNSFPVLHSFLDLIRHGKHHNHNNRTDPSKHPHTDNNNNNNDNDRRDPSPSSARATHHQQAQAQPQHAPPPDVASPGTREAAEMIVSEERDARTKMPTYKGLENFKLLEKMGESVNTTR